jgi:hypothetical protein
MAQVATAGDAKVDQTFFFRTLGELYMAKELVLREARQLQSDLAVAQDLHSKSSAVAGEALRELEKHDVERAKQIETGETP